MSKTKIINATLSEYFSRIGSKGGKNTAKRADISEIRKRAAETRNRNKKHKAALTKSAR